MNERAAAPTRQSAPPAPALLSGVLQRKCAGCGNHGLAGGECSGCKKKDPLRRKATCDADVQGVPSIVHDVLSSPGQPLEPGTRSFFDTRFGHDFSGVRIHSDGRAAESARAVNALAYTVGPQIVFGAGQYRPESTSGKHLLAHELAHVVQQQNSGAGALSTFAVGAANDPAEYEADLAAARVMSGSETAATSIISSAPVLRRACGSVEIGTPVGCREVPDMGPFVSPGNIYKFNQNCDTFQTTTNEESRLWADMRALPSNATIEIHGFASVDGDRGFNRQLACARARAARDSITRPAPAGGGVPASQIRELVNHGATPGPSDERRSVVIQTSVPAPPPQPPAAPPRTLPTGAFLDLQIACVTDQGGCANPATIPTLDTTCRTQTNYRGIPLVQADLVCGTPGLGIAQSLDRAYPGWLGLLPDCPCTRTDAENASNFSADMNPFLQRFHPGADTSFRSDPVASVPGTAHRQQCTYTRSGMLISTGGGAGTPDAWGTFSNHQRIDVQPFNEFGRNHLIYNRFWVPNRGRNCGPAQDPCINNCEVAFEACDEGLRCLAERQRCLSRCPPSTP
jgi:Domain of unknown function (DUF4157)